MESSVSQIIEIQDPSGGPGEVTKQVVTVKNINPALGRVVSLPVAESGNPSVVKVLRSDSVGMATDPKPDYIYIEPNDGVSNVIDAVYLEADQIIEKKTASRFESKSLVSSVRQNDQKVLNNIQKSMHSDTKNMKKVSNNNSKTSPVIMFKWGTTSKPFRCQICDLSFHYGHSLRTHMDKHARTRTEPLKPFPCKLCTKSFQSSRSLERHQFVHSGQSQKRCKYCYKVFANKENLDKHILMHSVNKSLICPFCGETCSTRNALEIHITSHTGQKHFKCQICEKTFNRKDTLDRHLLTHNIGKKTKHQCVECEKSFTFLFALKRHVRSVHGQEPDGKECEICGKFIKNRENVGRHMQIHEGKRPYACQNCGRKFTQKQHLVDHLVIHTNSLPFDCKICGVSFRYKRSLNRHHKKHYKFHSDKQKLECSKCSDLFADQKELVQHIEKVHYKVSECLLCKSDFLDVEVLLKHMEEIHGISKKTVSKKKGNLVHKSTETDAVVMETAIDPSVVKELPSYKEHMNIEVGDETQSVKKEKRETVKTENDVANLNEIIKSSENEEAISNEIIQSNENEEANSNEIIESSENEVAKSNGIIESSENGDNIIYTSKESDGISDCQQGQVIYILFGNGQEMVQKVLMNKSEMSEKCISDLSGQDRTITYALDGTQIVNTAEMGTQAAVDEQELENNTEIVEFTERTGNDNQVVEIAEEYPNLNVYQTDGTDGKEMAYKYNVVTRQVENQNRSNYGNDESQFVADRTELIQSLIDYAEKIQEEELSMTNSETKI